MFKTTRGPFADVDVGKKPQSIRERIEAEVDGTLRPMTIRERIEARLAATSLAPEEDSSPLASDGKSSSIRERIEARISSKGGTSSSPNKDSATELATASSSAHSGKPLPEMLLAKIERMKAEVAATKAEYAKVLSGSGEVESVPNTWNSNSQQVIAPAEQTDSPLPASSTASIPPPLFLDPNLRPMEPLAQPPQPFVVPQHMPGLAPPPTYIPPAPPMLSGSAMSFLPSFSQFQSFPPQFPPSSVPPAMNSFATLPAADSQFWNQAHTPSGIVGSVPPAVVSSIQYPMYDYTGLPPPTIHEPPVLPPPTVIQPPRPVTTPVSTSAMNVTNIPMPQTVPPQPVPAPPSFLVRSAAKSGTQLPDQIPLPSEPAPSATGQMKTVTGKDSTSVRLRYMRQFDPEPYVCIFDGTPKRMMVRRLTVFIFSWIRTTAEIITCILVSFSNTISRNYIPHCIVRIAH